MARWPILLLLGVVLLSGVGEGAQWSEPVNVSVSIGSPAHVDNFTFELLDFSYGSGGSNAWVILRTQYHNATVKVEPIEMSQSVPQFVHTEEPYEYAFSVGTLEYTTEYTDVRLTNVWVLFKGNPPKPKMQFDVSVLHKKPEVVASIQVEKRVRAAGYVNERFPIEINILSNLSIPLALNVSDTIPEEFVLDPYTNLTWNLVLEPHGTANISYTVQALKPGNYSLPMPVVKSEQSLLISWGEEARTLVLGPYVCATKEASVDEGGVVCVNVTLNNTGDEGVDVWLVDALPQGGRLVCGTLNITGHLEVNEHLNNSYAFVPPEGEVVLPPAQVLFVSQHRVDKYFTEPSLLPQQFRGVVDPRYAYGVSQSNMVVLNIPTKEEVRPPESPPPTPSNEQSREQPTEKKGMPAYDGVLLLIALVALTYLRKYL